MSQDLHPDLARVLRSAAELQSVVPDAVLVGGSAAAYHARRRVSFDHNHVLPDLVERYEAVLEAVETTDGWATSVRASTPPFTLMGSLGGVEAGLCQLRRTVPLATIRIELPGGDIVTAPTIDEALRVKAYLVVVRNQVRDYLDVAALADRIGLAQTATVRREIDNYYTAPAPAAGGDQPAPSRAYTGAVVGPLLAGVLIPVVRQGSHSRRQDQGSSASASRALTQRSASADPPRGPCPNSSPPPPRTNIPGKSPPRAELEHTSPCTPIGAQCKAPTGTTRPPTTSHTDRATAPRYLLDAIALTVLSTSPPWCSACPRTASRQRPWGPGSPPASAACSRCSPSLWSC